MYTTVNMASINERCVGAIVGCLVSDAAAVPLHWVYGADKVKPILAENPVPEFMKDSHCPFYKLPCGSNSCYGDQEFVLLQSIAEKGGYDEADYKKKAYDMFGKNSKYEVDLGHPITRADWPIPGPWRNSSIKEFVKRHDAGEARTGAPEDTQIDCMCKVVALSALLAGNASELSEKMENAVRVTQDTDMAVSFGLAAARLVEQCILGKTLEESIQYAYDKADDTVKDCIQKARDNKSKDHLDFCQEVGTNCPLPKNFINSIHCLLKSDGDFRNTVVMTLTSGGCNCSRTCLVGACMGALNGIKSVPKEWIDKTARGTEIVKLANKIVSLRS